MNCYALIWHVVDLQAREMNCYALMCHIVYLQGREMHCYALICHIVYLQAREMNCYALIYFYYRLLGTFMPISPTLGPMLNRLKQMVGARYTIRVNKGYYTSIQI
ncbi:hypothetical protein DPMN_159497 [Dreissena polymorpha]|uniref:Uncharacterized protein n=1 Tax=Dreissena polymorpha TaxID=45954 RepID=A0A9D4EL14_DREPO|nr:hypothetical protein DPMN_159497 [Dreissena polymorpha]